MLTYEQDVRKSQLDDVLENYPDKIEDYENRLFLIRDQDSLAKLAMFRKTTFGYLDLAILQKDDYEIIQQYDNLQSKNLIESQRVVGVGLALLRQKAVDQAQGLNEQNPTRSFNSILSRYNDLTHTIDTNNDIIQNWKYYSDTEKQTRLTENEDCKKEISQLLKYE